VFKQTVATFGQLDAAYNTTRMQNVLAETAEQGSGAIVKPEYR
jgi:hypothetical protein